MDVATEPSLDEVESIYEQLHSGESASAEDVSVLLDAIGGPLETHIQAAEALIVLADRGGRVLEDEYPELVESLLARWESITIARRLLHEIVELRDLTVPVDTIDAGYEMVGEELLDLDDIAEETAGSEEVVPGGGAVAAEMSLRLRDFADSVAGREQLVVEAVADAFEMVPRRIAKDAGVNPIDTLVDLRAQKHSDALATGVSSSGQVTEMDGEDDRVPVDDVFGQFYNAIVAVRFITHFERTPSQLLRSEALLAEEVR